jgi:ABC-type Mn2+/Zn2+ transport system ATPase subunit
MSAVTGRGVVIAYNGSVAVTASDFTVPAAAATAIIGPNGSGKSTLLNAIAGLIEPVAGTISVLGGSPASRHRDVAYVLQSTKMNEVMPVTVAEAVRMGRYARLGAFHRFGRADRAAVDEAMERLEITDLAGRHLTELSGGQRQRVFVAQGLAQTAELLLLDEPTTGFDLVSHDLISRAMEDELARGAGVVVTTHDLAEAGEADHMILVSGRVVAEGRPVDVMGPDLLSSAYGRGILHLEDGSIVLDDPHKTGPQRHVHFDRSGHDHTLDPGHH